MYCFVLRREKDSSISVEDLLYDIFKHNDADHLVVGDFLAVRKLPRRFVFPSCRCVVQCARIISIALVPFRFPALAVAKMLFYFFFSNSQSLCLMFDLLLFI